MHDAATGRVLLLDLGNTLVEYLRNTDQGSVVMPGLAAAADVLRAHGVDTAAPGPDAAELFKEAPDGAVRPLEARIESALGLDPGQAGEPAILDACRAFIRPMIDSARLYPDTLPVLEALRRRGYRLGLVSNMPWGSPVAPWEDELERHGIRPYLEHVVWCRDVGWRKPSGHIFAHALRLFGCTPDRCGFVGDRPDWDIRGAREAGLAAVLIDRYGDHPAAPPPRITSLAELPALLG